MRLILLIIFLCTTLVSIYPFKIEEGRHRVTVFSNSDGFDQNTITTICTDQNNVLWFGTTNGLIKYDGYDFENYYASSKESFQSNSVNKLYNDGNGCIWISTSDGLSIYNSNEEYFSIINEEKSTCYFSKYDDKMVVAHNNKVSLYADDSLLSDHTIYTANAVEINCAIAYAEHSLLLSNSQDIYYFDLKTKQSHLLSLPSSLKNRYILSMKMDGQFLWIGSTKGLFRCVLDNHKIVTVNSYKNDKQSLSEGPFCIQCLSLDHYGNLWIGTAKDGVYKYDQANDVFYHYACSEKPNCISSVRINDIVEDEYGIIWCGTAQGGLNKIDPTEKPFYTYAHSAYDKMSLPGNLINNIFQGTDGHVYFSFYNAPLCRTTSPIGDAVTNTLKFEEVFALPKDIIDKDVIKITQDNTGLWWWSTHTELYIYNNEKKESQVLKIHSADGSPIDISQVRVVKQIDNETILLGGDKLILLKNPWAAIGNNEPVVACSNYIVLGQKRIAQCIEKDALGVYWLGTQEGIETFRLVDDEISINNRINDETDVNDACACHIFSILKDVHNNMWVGTFGKGLINIKLDGDGLVQHIKKYDRNNGLSDEMVYGIVEQNDSTIWLSTDMGISKMNTKKGTINVYNINDGLANNNFRRDACLQTSSGMILMGGLNGLTLFDPDKIVCNQPHPKVYLTSLKVNNKVIQPEKNSILEQSITQTQNLVLDYSKRNISLEIIAQQYATPKKNQLEYKLDGIDDDWIRVKNGKVLANYTNLPAGNFSFHYRAANGDDIWTKNDRMLKITVLAPWHKRWWSITLSAILTIAILFFIINYYLKNEKLEHSLKLERVDKQRIHELNQAKLRFFTNVSHEFKTPLSLIMAPLEKIIEQSKNEENKKYISIIQGNIDRLQRLIDNLINFRKNESGKINTHYSKTTLEDFTYPLLEAFEESMTAKNIDFTYQVNTPGEYIVIDEEKTELILFNLLSNAIKFTREDGAISLSTSFEKIKGKEYITFTVTDNGIGIPSKNLERIFDRFYRIEDIKNQSKGFGIGLAFSKSLVDSMNGFLEVESQPNVATSFKVILPFTNEPSTIVKKRGLHAIHNLPKTEEFENETRAINSDLNTLLVIDDEPDFRHFLTHAFEEKYNIICAKDGETGLEKLNTNKVDLVICDVMMPGISGFEVCKKIKATPETEHIPVILLTALTTHENELKGIDLGAEYYLKKPFSIKQLEVRVAKLIENRTKLKEHYSSNSYLPDDSISMTGKERLFLKTVNDIIERKMSNSSFGVEELAREAGCSTSHFYRRLKLLTGQIPNAYLRNYRLQKASELLSADKTINAAEVMYHIGIESPSYFSTSFKKVYGMSPSEYKNKAKSR